MRNSIGGNSHPIRIKAMMISTRTTKTIEKICQVPVPRSEGGRVIAICSSGGRVIHILPHHVPTRSVRTCTPAASRTVSARPLIAAAVWRETQEGWLRGVDGTTRESRLAPALRASVSGRDTRFTTHAIGSSRRLF